jgi:hypothetical protein
MTKRKVKSREEKSREDHIIENFCRALGADNMLSMQKFNASVRQLANSLDAYMRFRAEQEGVDYQLTVEFYEDRLKAGVVGFFGVHFANGELTEDEQFPHFFEQWKRRH